MSTDTTKCTAHPLNGCAHPQFCKDGCAGRPIKAGGDQAEWTQLYRDLMRYASAPIGDHNEH